MNLNDLVKPKPATEYSNLTNGGDFTVNLNKEESCVALKIHDYGVDTLTEDEKVILHSLIGKLKDEIWP